MEQGRDALVEEEGQKRDEGALEQVEGHDGKEHERRDAGDVRVDLGAHADDSLHRHAVERGELRQQIDRVERAAENRHAERADDKADERALLAGLCVIDKARGQDERAADGKVGKVADKGRRRALQEKLDQHLDELRRHAGDRAEVKGADQDRQLAKVDLIERRREGQRDLDEHQHTRHRGEDRRVGDVVRAREGLDVAAELFLQEGRDEHDGREDCETGEDECQVFHGFASFFLLRSKEKCPKSRLFEQTKARAPLRTHDAEASSTIRTVPSVSEFHRFVPFSQRACGL